MATVINNPGTEADTGTGTGVVVGILVVILLAILFLVFGLPYLRNGGSAPASNSGSASFNVDLPGNNGGATGNVSGGQ
jgi:hypothetical protein